MSDIEGLQEGKGGEEGSSPVILRIVPAEAAVLAHEVAEQYSERFQKPLEDFLIGSAEIDGIEGVGLVIWKRPQSPRFLSIYPFSDLSGLSLPQTPSPRRRFAELFSEHFETPEIDPRYLVNTEIASVNTHNGLANVLSRFPLELRDPFTGERPVDEIAVLARVAIPERNRDHLH